MVGERNKKRHREKGENAYHSGAKLKLIKMRSDTGHSRNAKGEVIKYAPFASAEASRAVRVEPSRKWFGNTRTITQESINEIASEIVREVDGNQNKLLMNDPYKVLVNTKQVPYSLIESIENNKLNKTKTLVPEGMSFPMAANKLSTSYIGNNILTKNALSFRKNINFANAFSGGKSSMRLKPSLSIFDVEGYAKEAYEKGKHFGERAGGEEDIQRNLFDPLFTKGKSKRIWNELYKVIDSSDIVAFVLDARDPIGTRCKKLEEHLKNNCRHKHVIFILNKIDLVPVSVSSYWLNYLSCIFPVIGFHASIQHSFGRMQLTNLFKQVRTLSYSGKQDGGKKHSISVGMIGYPNVGKSSIINTLRSKKICSVAPIPGQTKVWQYVTLTRGINLIDCPGIVPYAEDTSNADLVLKGAIRIENLESPIDYIPHVFNKISTDIIESTYNVDLHDIFTEDKKDEEWSLRVCSLIARKMGRLLKGGEPDINTTSRKILVDWIRGDIPHYIDPIKNPPAPAKETAISV